MVYIALEDRVYKANEKKRLMIITRKIQVYVHTDDPQEKKDFIHTIYGWRDLTRRAANIIVAHKFVQQNIRDFVYLKDGIKEKFNVSDIIKDGKGMSEQNTTYRIVSALCKGKMPSDIYSCLNQAVAHTFKETVKDMNMGKASVRSYKNSIPMPFSAKALSNIHWDEGDRRFYFTLFGIPFACALGADRSNNEAVINKAISGEYKMCSSSLMIDDERKRMYLLLCVDVPAKKPELDQKKCLYAFLGAMNPITFVVDVKAKQEFDSGKKVFTIGTADEFFHRRRQIQEALKRCQVEMRYAKGGKGRRKKLKAIERWHDRENNYVDTKLHTYSRMLVDAAVRHGCASIVLMKQKEREKDAKDGDRLVLRNWSYFGLKQKIEYKSKLAGVVVADEK